MSGDGVTVAEIVAYAFEHGATYVASHRPVTFSDAAMWEMVDGDPVQETLRREEYDMGREVVQMSFHDTNRVDVTVDDTGRVRKVRSLTSGTRPWKRHKPSQWREVVEEQGATA